MSEGSLTMIVMALDRQAIGKTDRRAATTDYCNHLVDSHGIRTRPIV